LRFVYECPSHHVASAEAFPCSIAQSPLISRTSPTSAYRVDSRIDPLSLCSVRGLRLNALTVGFKIINEETTVERDFSGLQCV